MSDPSEDHPEFSETVGELGTNTKGKSKKALETTDRRKFLKTTGTTTVLGITALAGCSSGAQDEEQPNNNSNSRNPDNTSTSDGGSEPSDTNYNPHIETGREFDELIDWRHGDAVRDDYYDSEIPRESLFLIPRRITRDLNKTGDLSEDTLSVIDQIAPNVIGRALVGAPKSDTGTEVSIGIDDAGIADVKYSPETIEERLNKNLTYNENKDRYEGSFVEKRPHVGNPDLERDVILRHDGNTIKWAAGKEEGKGYDQVFSDVGETFNLIDQTTDDEIESVLEGNGSLMNKIADELQNVFNSDRYSNYHELTFAPLPPTERSGENAVKHGNVRIKRYVEDDGLELVKGDIVEYEDGFEVEKDRTITRKEDERDMTDLSFTYTPDYSNL